MCNPLHPLNRPESLLEVGEQRADPFHSGCFYLPEPSSCTSLRHRLGPGPGENPSPRSPFLFLLTQDRGPNEWVRRRGGRPLAPQDVGLYPGGDTPLVGRVVRVVRDQGESPVEKTTPVLTEEETPGKAIGETGHSSSPGP